MDSGFHIRMDSGFLFGFWIPLAGFRIPQTKITWIPDSGLPYMGRYVVRSDVSVTFDEICVVVVLNKNSVQVLDFVGQTVV